MNYTSCETPSDPFREVSHLSTRFTAFSSMLFALALFPGLPHASAQANSPRSVPVPAQPPAAEPSASSDSRLITINVSVADSKDAPVAGLTRNDFSLFDNKKPARILAFKTLGSAQTPDRPSEMIIVIDAINLEFQYVAYTREQVDGFLRSNEGHLAQPTSIYVVTDTGVSVMGAPTTDGNALAQTFKQYQSGLRDLRRDGVYAAYELFSMSVQKFMDIIGTVSDQPGRKLVIWIGPGWPMLAGPAVLEPARKAQQQYFDTIVRLSTVMRQSQVTLDSVSGGLPNAYTYYYESYVKGVKSVNDALIPDLSEKVIAAQSGGIVIPPDFGLGINLAKCVNLSSIVYQISFDAPPTEKTDQFHSLEVRVDRPGVKVYTNTGYYDQP